MSTPWRARPRSISKLRVLVALISCMPVAFALYGAVRLWADDADGLYDRLPGFALLRTRMTLYAMAMLAVLPALLAQLPGRRLLAGVGALGCCYCVWREGWSAVAVWRMWSELGTDFRSKWFASSLIQALAALIALVVLVQDLTRRIRV